MINSRNTHSRMLYFVKIIIYEIARELRVRKPERITNNNNNDNNKYDRLIDSFCTGPFIYYIHDLLCYLFIYQVCIMFAARIQTRIRLFYMRFCIAYRAAFATKIELFGRCLQNDRASIREQDDERWLPRGSDTRSFLMKCNI